MKRIIRDYVFLAAVVAVIVTLDQLSKGWIMANLAMGEIWAPVDWMAPFARLVYWYNTGVAFGLFQDSNQFFKILSIIVALVIIYYYPKVAKNDWTLRLALSLQLGGALGNLTDRFRWGHVIDFISVGNFPVFNVADSSITMGVVVLILGVWLQERRQKKLQLAEGDAGPAESTAENSQEETSSSEADNSAEKTSLTPAGSEPPTQP